MELKLMAGTGNTFVMANLMTEVSKRELLNYFPSKSLCEIAKSLCLHPMVDCDGAVFIVPSKEYDFKWLFYNRDGSEAEMCGNAARCVTLFAHDEKVVPLHCQFETLAGNIMGEILEDHKIKVQMPKIKDIQLNQMLKDNDVFTKFDYMDSGVPHCVIKVNSLEDMEDLRPLALQLRKPQYFSPRGANITFRVAFGTHRLKAVSFERGVEDFTEACGTGAVAAAYSHATENNSPSIVEVSMPGGELMVEFTKDFPYLIGTVSYLATIELEAVSCPL